MKFETDSFTFAFLPVIVRETPGAGRITGLAAGGGTGGAAGAPGVRARHSCSKAANDRGGAAGAPGFHSLALAFILKGGGWLSRSKIRSTATKSASPNDLLRLPAQKIQLQRAC